MDPKEVRPLTEQIASVKREIGMRERVYPHLVKSGKLKEEKAAAELLAMRSVLDTLENLASGGEPTQSHLVIEALSKWIAYVDARPVIDYDDRVELNAIKAEAIKLGFVWPE
jgi:hypothetical protein